MALAYDLSDELKAVIRKLKNRDAARIDILYKKIRQIVESGEEGIAHYKNLGYAHSDKKRAHIDKSFVLTFRYDREKKFVLFLAFGHHDDIYT